MADGRDARGAHPLQLRPVLRRERPERIYGRIPDDDLIGEYEAVRERLGRAPTSTELSRFGQFHADTYRRRWGSWQAFLRLMGDPSERTASRDDLLAAYRAIRAQLGRVPTLAELGKLGPYAQRTYTKHLGDYFEVVLAGEGLRRQDIVSDMHRMAAELGKLPHWFDVEKHGRYPAWMYSRAFGSFAELRRRACESKLAEE